ncbi:MAG: hypothetical protein DDT26_02443 [Dehalococcoidia bacterium]|nr:hypothetical protein [Chloroflexota bacterium]
MSVDDGQGGYCRICDEYHLIELEPLCTGCLQRTLDEATSAETVSEALEIIRERLFQEEDKHVDR